MGIFDQLRSFLADVRQEGGRVQWPAPRQAVMTSVGVLVFVVITAVFLGGVDFVFSKLLTGLMN